MSEDMTPGIREWRRLYESAVRIKEISPWEWMTETDVFGVRSPESGELGTTSSIPTVPHIEPLATSVSLPRFRFTFEWLLATHTIAQKVTSFTGGSDLDVTKWDLQWGVCYTQ